MRVYRSAVVAFVLCNGLAACRGPDLWRVVENCGQRLPEGGAIPRVRLEAHIMQVGSLCDDSLRHVWWRVTLFDDGIGGGWTLVSRLSVEAARRDLVWRRFIGDSVWGEGRTLISASEELLLRHLLEPARVEARDTLMTCVDCGGIIAELRLLRLLPVRDRSRAGSADASIHDGEGNGERQEPANNAQHKTGPRG